MVAGCLHQRDPYPEDDATRGIARSMDRKQLGLAARTLAWTSTRCPRVWSLALVGVLYLYWIALTAATAIAGAADGPLDLVLAVLLSAGLILQGPLWAFAHRPRLSRAEWRRWHLLSSLLWVDFAACTLVASLACTMRPAADGVQDLFLCSAIDWGSVPALPFAVAIAFGVAFPVAFLLTRWHSLIIGVVHIAASAAPGLLAGVPFTLRNATIAVHLACCVALAIVVVSWFIRMRSLTGRALVLEKDAKLLRVKEAAARAAFHSHEQTVGFVFHELRNPLHRVLGSLWLLKEQWSHSAGHELTSELRNVERGVRQIRGLLDDVVDLDRFRHGTVRLKPSLASLPGILRDAMHRVHRLHAHACIVPVVEDSAAELDTCVVDPGRLRQIAVHALSRAARASEDRVVILRLCADGVPSPLPPVLPPGRWSRARGGVRDSRIAHAASTASQTSGPPSRQHSTPLAAGAAPSPAPAQPVYSSPRYESAPCDSGSSDTQSDSQRSSGSFAFLRKLWPSSAEKAAHEAHRPGSRHGQDAEAGEVATRLDGTSPTARRAEADEASPPSSFAAESEESDAARDLPPWIRYFTSNNGTVVRTGWLPEDEASLAARQYPDADWMHLHVQYVTLQVIDAGPSLRPEDEVVHGVEDRCAAPSSSSGGGGGGGGRVGPGQPAGAGGDGDESDEEEAAAPAKGGAGDPASPPVTPSPAAPPAEGRAPLMDIGEDAHVSTAFAGVGMPLVQRLVAEMRGSLALVNRASRPLSETDAKRVQSCLLRQLCEPPTDRVPRLARRFDTVSSIGTLGSGAASQSGGAQRGAAEAATPSRDALRRALATARAEQGTLFHVRIPILTYRPSPSPIRLPVAPVVGSGSAVSTRSVPGAPASVQGPASARRGPVSLAVAPAAKEEDGTGGRWKFPLPDPTAEGGEAAPVRGSDPGGGPWAMAGAAAVGGDEVAEPGVVMSLQRRPGAGQQYSWGRQLGRQLTPSPPASGGDQRRKRWRHSDEVSVRDEWASRVLSGTAVGLADRAHGSVTDSPGSVGRRGSIGSTAGSSCRRGSTDTRRVESAAVLPGTSPLFLRQGSARTQSATGLAEGAATAAPEALRVSVRGDHALGGGAAGQRSQQRSADAASPPVMDDHAAGRMRTRATSSTSVSPSAQAESVRGGSLAGGEAPSTTTDAAPSNDSTAPAAGSREPSHRTGRRLWKTARALVDEEREEGASHASRQRSAAEGSGQFMSPDTSFSLTGPGQAPVPATGGDAAADAFASGSSDHRLLRRTGGPGGGVAGPQARGHALALRSLMLDPQARAAPSSQAGSDGASGGGSSGDGRSSESVHSSIRTPSVSQRVASMSQGPFLSSAASWRVHSGGGSTVVGRRSVRPPTLPPIPSDAAEAGVADGAQEDGGAPAAVGTTSGAAVSATMPPLPAPPAPAAPPSGDGAAGAVALPAVQGKGAPSSTALPQLPSVPGLPQAQATPMDTAPVSRGVTRAPERGGAGATSTAEEAAGSSGGRRLRDLNVLIVDDEQTNRRLMRHMLRRIGVGAVEEADDGKTGLEAVFAAERAGRPFDVLMLDIVMCGMHGDEMLRRLRQQGTHLPAVACTGNALPQDMAHYQQVGFLDIVTKPFGVRDLKRAMKAAIPGLEAAAE